MNENIVKLDAQNVRVKNFIDHQLVKNVKKSLSSWREYMSKLLQNQNQVPQTRVSKFLTSVQHNT